MKISSLSLLLALTTAAPLAAQPPSEWLMHKTPDGLHPSPVEQQMLWLMNRARSNPNAEAAYLTNTGDEGINFYLGFFNVKINLMQAEFAAMKPAPPAAFDRRLHDASRLHSEYLIRIDNQTHAGQDTLLNKSGFAWSTARLSIFSYAESGLQCHAALNIDYGPSASGMQEGRGHRAAIMADLPGPVLSNVGLAAIPEFNPFTEVGPYVFSGAYAAAVEGSPEGYNRFVVGTVWSDLNKNKQYDEGEGLPNVKVELDHGPWFARTGIAGGYSIPVTEPGNYMVGFSGLPFLKAHYRKVTIGAESVLVDAELTSLPPSHPQFETSIRIDPAAGVVLKWFGGQPPYQIQRSRSLEAGWENLGLPTLERSAILPLEGKGGFFRVKDSG